MLDIGWTELLVVAIVLVVVVGPRELPHVLRTFGKTMTKFRRMASDFRSQMDDALKEADMEDVSTAIRDVRRINPANQLRDAINPLRQTARDIDSDLRKSTALDNKPKPKADGPELKKASYPTPGTNPDVSPVNAFDKAAAKKDEAAPALVSKPRDEKLVSHRPGFKAAPRPVKSKSSGGRRSGR
ncbi:Sec-independent protein translocase protein TatB [Martelella mediterranea]|uniref:Sec-independent protein translocase protein TatB n=1 Tax=Martelella mediterranea DSM 17316 TaxID=1122214 RepID=A0A1U9Z2W7_9HYPH|nr:Sec-independent protein translocase protein TatB [Martelella mediterranea DSM 17316]